MYRVNSKKMKKWFLAGGVISSLLFYSVSIVQMLIRDGFDIRHHAISTLTLGDAGWIQSANFIVTGVLSMLASMGMLGLLKGVKGGILGALLIGIYGIGMILAGLFRPDPGFGFPVGAPEGMPESMSGEAALHNAAFFIAFICLVAAAFVIARGFASNGERGWRNVSMAVGIISPLLIAAGMGTGSWVGVFMGCAGLVAFGWVSLLSARFHAELNKM